MSSDATSTSPRDLVSAKSHVPDRRFCQCKNWQQRICGKLKILGVNMGGSFTEYPAILEVCSWKNGEIFLIDKHRFRLHIGERMGVTLTFST